MEADGARFLWLDEYRRREIFGEFASPEERGRWSATLVGALSDTQSTEASDTCRTCGHNAGQALDSRALSALGTCEGLNNRILRPGAKIRLPRP